MIFLIITSLIISIKTSIKFVKEMSNDSEAVNKKLIVIRVRGRVKIRKKVTDTLKLLRLNRINHAVLIDGRDSYKGMLATIKDYVTWGEIEQETLELLLKNRGMIEGRKPLSDEFLAKNTTYKSIGELANAIMSNEIDMKDIKRLKPLFRLHPPKGGYKGKLKRPYLSGGILGDRKKEINKLIKRMV
jgi:large subunit ribosomal protein L30